MKPWVVLLALKPGEFEFSIREAPPRQEFASGSVSSLPDLAQSWAFAHVHVAHGDSSAVTLPG